MKNKRVNDAQLAMVAAFQLIELVLSQYQQQFSALLAEATALPCVTEVSPAKRALGLRFIHDRNAVTMLSTQQKPHGKVRACDDFTASIALATVLQTNQEYGLDFDIT